MCERSCDVFDSIILGSIHLIKCLNYDDQGKCASLLTVFLSFLFAEQRVSKARHVCTEAPLIIFPLVEFLNLHFQVGVFHHILMAWKQ